MAAIERLNNLLNKLLMIGAGVAVLVLMLIATGNVVLRVLGVPFRGAYELVGFSGAIVIAFAMGTTQKRRATSWSISWPTASPAGSTSGSIAYST